MQQRGVDQELDARNLMCPEPVLRARVALDAMSAHQVLKVRATDPHSELDFEVFCARTGHILEHRSVDDDGVLGFWIRRRADQADSSPV